MKNTLPLGLLLSLLGSSSLFADNLAAGRHHSSVVRNDGSLWTWGTNPFGQLGLGTGPSSAIVIPTQLGADSDWSLVSSGEHHSVAVKKNAVAYLWGDNSFGQLGQDPTTLPFSDTPQMLTLSEDIQSIATGPYNTYLVNTAGIVFSAGRNHAGQCGVGTNSNVESSFSAVTLPSPALKVSAGADFAIALTHKGQLFAWGSHQFGQLGLGSGAQPQELNPIQIGTDSDWIDVACGGHHVLALKKNGDLYTWGKNTQNQSGQSTDQTDLPQLLLSGVESISAGREHSQIMKNVSEIWGLGLNDSGQLGAGHLQLGDSLTMTQNTDWLQVISGPYHSLALKKNGELFAWGQNQHGQTSDSQNKTMVPHQVTLPASTFPIAKISPVTGLTAGEDVSMVAHISDGNYSVTWSVGNSPSGAGNFDDSTLANANFFGGLPGLYELNLSTTNNDTGEVSVAKIYINIEPALLGSMVWGTHSWNPEPAPQ